MEWAPSIRVNAIIAGLIKTEASSDHYGGEKGMQYLADNLPMKRMGTPYDIAKACIFLADSNNSYISGACLEVFGKAWRSCQTRPIDCRSGPNGKCRPTASSL